MLPAFVTLFSISSISNTQRTSKSARDPGQSQSLRDPAESCPISLTGQQQPQILCAGSKTLPNPSQTYNTSTFIASPTHRVYQSCAAQRSSHQTQVEHGHTWNMASNN